MKHHPAWLAAGLLVFVVLACSLGNKNNTNTETNSNTSSSKEPQSQSGSGLAIKEIHMARDNSGKPGDETDSFAPSDRTIHCVATLKEAKSGTQMKFSWWIVDADGTQNQKIKDIDYKTRALENIVHGHLSLPQDWPSGKYKVEIYINGDLDKTVFYSVR
ncbi:MAG: hypothetical protein ABR556_06620 [Pyrinomonadaceae bacterium]